MPRQARKKSESGIYHIMLRGINKQQIFEDEEDFYKVINIKSKQWLNTDMEKYLRPVTLFSNKFEGYLNEEVDLIEVTYELEDIKPFDIEFDF